MTVREAQERISSHEFAEWMAYANLEPFGPEREDQRAGVVAATLANINRDTKARPEPYSVEDFFPRYDTIIAPPEPAELPPEKLENKLRNWAMIMNAQNEKARPKSELRKKE